MRNALRLFIVTSLLITTIFGCKKGGNTPEPVIPDTTKPTISVAKPTAGQAFIPRNTIPFQATFADNVKISSYEIAITNLPLLDLS